MCRLGSCSSLYFPSLRKAPKYVSKAIELLRNLLFLLVLREFLISPVPPHFGSSLIPKEEIFEGFLLGLESWKSLQIMKYLA